MGGQGEFSGFYEDMRKLRLTRSP
ncbi:uncharacterized protein G2W53_001556 [Senna tora]|uniref:Uncharacterized protein n=1 Tax=Senna tora TaxID=362788 RepID=A0A835CKF0_9FABA|nr:uncharacterized protein G2W53_001556 [Senna tora]